MKDFRKLSKQDLMLLMEIIYMMRLSITERHFELCFKKLRSILLFDSIQGSYVDKLAVDKNNIPVFFHYAWNFSYEFLQQYAEKRYFTTSAVFQATYRTWQPQHWKTNWKRIKSKEAYRSMHLAHAYGYLDGWCFAADFPQHNAFSFFSIAGQKVEKNNRTATILNYISPHFCEALKESFQPSFNSQKINNLVQLTDRELEILKWLGNGKSTWEISVILNRSESVIKWHINNLMEKLSALNRSHAVAIAMRQGLIK